MKVFSVAEMVAAEQAADAAGVSYATMMENAGRAVAVAILDRIDPARASVLVLVGPGNNGGDGLVAGRFLAEAGADVAFYLSRPRDPESDENFAVVRERGLMVLEAGMDQRYRVLRHRLNITDVVIDALLGTGVSRPIEGELAGLMRQLGAGIAERGRVLARERQPVLRQVGASDPAPLPRPMVVAVDCPSGLNCDTGALDRLAVPADLTVTFAGPKRGHFIFPGAAACGELVTADIHIAADLPEVAGVALDLATADLARSLLPPRPADGHKGTFGTALICAGQAEYWGAPVLAGLGALRVGAGLVSLAVPAAVRATAAAHLIEATYPPVADAETLSAEAAAELEAGGALDRADALLVGPGLGPAESFLLALLARESLPPLVLDADGLNLLASQPDWPALLPAGTVLTPHPGELARLMDTPLAELMARDRVSLAREQAKVWQQVVLLKGAYTVVAAPDGRATLLPFANPALATGGSGDVLSGVIVSLRAQGVGSYEAAVLGGFLHGSAAALAAAEHGHAGVLVREIAAALPEARRRLGEPPSG
jgi:NAD(P)H-hydrate epimerase